MSALTLTLLLPGKSIAVQSWTFDSEKVIRIGRSADNDVVLYSAVVSRYHLELRREGKGWQAVNIGANGTYVDEQTIETMAVEDGLVVRLASSGPKIQINLLPDADPSRAAQDKTGQGHRPHPGDARQTMVSP